MSEVTLAASPGAKVRLGVVARDGVRPGAHAADPGKARETGPDVLGHLREDLVGLALVAMHGKEKAQDLLAIALEDGGGRRGVVAAVAKSSYLALDQGARGLVHDRRITPRLTSVLAGDYTLVTTHQEHDWKTAANGAMARYAAGDDTAFPELYRQLAPRLHAFLYRRLRDPSLAEDVLQQTFLQIHGARSRFAPGSEVMPWAFAIARRLLIDGFRKPRLEVDDAVVADSLSAGPCASPPALVDQRRLMSRVGEALEQIAPTHRIAFELVKLDGMAAPEAAKVLGTTAMGVRLRVHRALEALRDALDLEVREALVGWT